MPDYDYDEWDDDDENPNQDDDWNDGGYSALLDDRDDPETTCCACYATNCLDNCHQCGAPLCRMHSELGCGFCPSCPNGDYHPEDMPLTFRDRLHAVWSAIRDLFPRRERVVDFDPDEIPF